MPIGTALASAAVATGTAVAKAVPPTLYYTGVTTGLTGATGAVAYCGYKVGNAIYSLFNYINDNTIEARNKAIAIEKDFKEEIAKINTITDEGERKKAFDELKKRKPYMFYKSTARNYDIDGILFYAHELKSDIMTYDRELKDKEKRQQGESDQNYKKRLIRLYSQNPILYGVTDCQKKNMEKEWQKEVDKTKEAGGLLDIDERIQLEAKKPDELIRRHKLYGIKDSPRLAYGNVLNELTQNISTKQYPTKKITFGDLFDNNRKSENKNLIDLELLAKILNNKKNPLDIGNNKKDTDSFSNNFGNININKKGDRNLFRSIFNKKATLKNIKDAVTNKDAINKFKKYMDEFISIVKTQLDTFISDNNINDYDKKFVYLFGHIEVCKKLLKYLEENQQYDTVKKDITSQLDKQIQIDLKKIYKAYEERENYILQRQLNDAINLLKQKGITDADIINNYKLIAKQSLDERVNKFKRTYTYKNIKSRIFNFNFLGRNIKKLPDLKIPEGNYGGSKRTKRTKRSKRSKRTRKNYYY